jgi:hypothetical protein
METKEFGGRISDDNRALEYLWSKKGEAICHYCTYSQLGSKHVRCKQCKRDYWSLKATKFSLMNISPSKWLYLIKLFDYQYRRKMRRER